MWMIYVLIHSLTGKVKEDGRRISAIKEKRKKYY